MNLELLKNIPVDLNSAMSVQPGTRQIKIQNMGGVPINLATSILDLSINVAGNCVQCNPGQVYINDLGDTGAFAISYYGNAYVNITAL